MGKHLWYVSPRPPHSFPRAPFHPLPAAMNARFSLLAAAALSFLSLASASAATATLFHESFDENSQSWSDGTHNKDSFGTPDNAGWSISSGNVYPGLKGLRLGTASALGGAKSPSFALSNRTEDVTITVVAAAHQNASGTQTLHVDVLNSSSETSKAFSVTLTKISGDVEIPETANFVKTFTLSASEIPAAGNLSLNLYGESTSASQRRVLVGDVLVTQNYNSGLTQLNAPTGLVASNNDYTSFFLSWNSVADATGYTVTVKNANNEEVGTPVVNGTGATVTGLASGGTYTAYVVALGDGTTHDDSEPASLPNIPTTAPTVLDTPTGLASSNVGYFGFTLSWSAVSDATSYTVTLSPSAGSVAVDGTTATVTGLAEGETYTVSVVAKGNGTTTIDSTAATLDVSTDTAPAVSAPILTATDVSSSAFTVSWPAQNDAAFSVRAWTLVPADVATEDFAGFPEVEPEGWTFNGTEANTTASAASHPVAFKSSCSMVSPVYPSDISSLSFDLQHGNATSSSFSVFGSNDGGETWTPLVEYSNAGTHISNGEKTVSVSTPGIRQIKFEYTKSSGNLYLGSFSVTGTGVGKQPSYLTGYGPDATAVAGTSVTISNPVADETNYVEVTATGLSGKTASTTLPVAVPAAAQPRSVVISVK